MCDAMFLEELLPLSSGCEIDEAGCPEIWDFVQLLFFRNSIGPFFSKECLMNTIGMHLSTYLVSIV